MANFDDEFFRRKKFNVERIILNQNYLLIL
jgi:hypothetical protein